MDKILFSSKSDHWRTPKEIYNFFIDEGFFDPCPYNSDFDGLSIEWKEANFVNPPYSKIKKWVLKAIEENKKGKLVVLLIPARTDTQYFRQLVNYGVDILFITGRLSFNDLGTAPFPSCLIDLKGNYITNSVWIDKNDLFKDGVKE